MLQAIIGTLCGIGLYFVIADIYRLPYLKTSKAVLNLSKKQKDKSNGLDVWLKGLAVWLSKRLRLNEFKRVQLESDLKTAQMDISPEMF
ncbi:MAG: secretion protein F, partial [Eubacteriales bacterium]|nr:secretion protein F [Eubacteriales bacterium]